MSFLIQAGTPSSREIFAIARWWMSILRNHQIDTVVHFAAESHVDRSILDPHSFIRPISSVRIPCSKQPGRLGWSRTKPMDEPRVSTTFPPMKSLGPWRQDEPAFEENTPYAPRSPYAASKASSDHLVRAYGHTYGLPDHAHQLLE